MDMTTVKPCQDWAIELINVSLTRNNRTILHSLNWKTSRNTCCVLLGPNGAGKSSILALVTGYLWPNSGRVRVLGRTYGSIDLFDLRRQIGTVGHSRMPDHHPEMTTLQTVVTGHWGTIVIPDHIRPTEKQWQAARNELERGGLPDRESTPFGLLSSGEKIRTLLARALVSRPGLLILDEPTLSLDIGARADFRSMLDGLICTRDDLSILLVTHHVEDIPEATHKIALVANGRISASGPVEEMLTAEKLSKVFQRDVKVMNHDGRWQLMI
jgi:iron complex transport system ATP-binding protein